MSTNFRRHSLISTQAVRKRTTSLANPFDEAMGGGRALVGRSRRSRLRLGRLPPSSLAHEIFETVNEVGLLAYQSLQLLGELHGTIV
jgi:hypothetical protein